MIPTSTTEGSNSQPRHRQRRQHQPPSLLLAAGLLDALTRAATLPLSARAEGRNRGEGQQGDNGATATAARGGALLLSCS